MRRSSKIKRATGVIIVLCLMAASLSACSAPKNPFAGGGVSAEYFVGNDDSGDAERHKDLFTEDEIHSYDFTSLSTGDSFTVSVPEDSAYTLKCGDNTFAVMKGKTEVLFGGFSDVSAFEEQVEIARERNILPIDRQDDYLYFLLASDAGPEYDRAIRYNNTCILIASTEPQEDGDEAYSALSIVPR